MSWSKRKCKKKTYRFKRKFDPTKWTFEVAYMPPHHGLEVESDLLEILTSQEQRND